MATEVINKIKNCIHENKHFILEAGAGAGKTYTLMETINYLQTNSSIAKNKKQNVLCITYTNIAKDEIIERLRNKSNIIVQTMHEFLWNFIKQYQNELKKIIVQFLKDEEKELNEEIESAKKLIEKPRKNTNVNKKIEEVKNKSEKLDKIKNVNLDGVIVRYESYRALHKGVISHNDILGIATHFLKNKIFSRLLIDTFTHIFIDEYQDTNKQILNQILECIKENKGDKYIVLGLFGDRMQQIYSSNDLNIDYISYGLTQITKLDNYRTCKEIIESNNIFRGDGLLQEPGNMKIGLNKLEFIYNHNSDIYLKKYCEIDVNEYKRLFLSHNEIAKELGFEKISNIFSNEYKGISNDKLLKKEDIFIKFVLDNVIPLIYDFKNDMYSTIIGKYSLKYFNRKDLIALKNKLELNLNNDTKLEAAIKLLSELNLVSLKKYKEIIEQYLFLDKEYFVQQLIDIDISEYLMLFKQIDKHTNLETLHGVKGDEFENVIVNLREAQKWTNYNFDELILSGNNGKNSVNSAHKLLYVACTRAKKSLIINYMVTTEDDEKKNQIFKNIRKLFGENIIIKEY